MDGSGNEAVGGLVGKNVGYFGNDEGTVESAYWDAETTGQETSAGSPDENGLPTGEMTGDDAPAGRDGFDFQTTWVTVTDPEDYPVLATGP